jgi:predicted ArsR family transcriptional regulator
MNQLDVLIAIYEADGPVIAKEVGITNLQMQRLETLGFVERPKKDPVRKIENQRGRPSYQWRLTDKGRGRAKRALKQAQKAVTIKQPAKVETETETPAAA